MRQSDRTNPQLAKRLARQKYKERQIDKFVKWAIQQKGYIKWNDIVQLHEQYNIKVYG
jgi:hypothetical protein